MEPVLDTHFHLWNRPAIRYSWIDEGIARGTHFVGPGTLPPSFSAADYLALWSPLGFEPFVHVEAGADADHTLDESRWLRGELALFAHPCRAVVPADLRDPALRSTLEEHLALLPGVVGVRHIVTWSPDPARTFVSTDPLDEPAWEQGLDVLESLGLGFDLQIYPGQAHRSAELAAAHPGVRFILNHALLPQLDDQRDWQRAVAALATRPNIAIKLGGFAMGNPAWSHETVVAAMRFCVDTFGPDRSMIATNAPVETARSRAERFADATREVLSSFSPAEASEIASGSARRWYRVS